MELVTPNPDLCRGLQAPLLLIKISEDFEKETVRLEGLGRPQMLSPRGGRKTRHSFLLACRVQGQVASALEILEPPETPWKSLRPTWHSYQRLAGVLGKLAEITANCS